MNRQLERGSESSKKQEDADLPRDVNVQRTREPAEVTNGK